MLEEKQWLRDMEQDALKMGAHDFALKHKVYNLPVWERMQTSPTQHKLVKDMIGVLSQTRKFLTDYLNAMPAEHVASSATGQWLNYTIKKITTIINTYEGKPDEEVQRT